MQRKKLIVKTSAGLTRQTHPGTAVKCFSPFVQVFVLTIVFALIMAPATIIWAEKIAWSTEPATANQNGRWPELAEITCGSYIIIDRDNGEVLLALEPDKQLYPASTTKVLTALIALEELSPDKLLTVSEQAVKLTAGSSKVGYLAGEEVYARDLMTGLMLASGNDAANAVAEAVSGSEAAFAVIMNERARAAGATNSNFVNPSGLHVAEHVTTARDLAMIASAAMKNSNFCDLVALENASMPATNKHPLNGWAIFANTNRLLLYGDSYLAAPELKSITGVKTGSTNAAGDNLIAAATAENGTRLIGVLMGVPLQLQTSNKFVFMRTLLLEAARKATANKPTPAPTKPETTSTTTAASTATSTSTSTATSNTGTSAATGSTTVGTSNSGPDIANPGGNPGGNTEQPTGFLENLRQRLNLSSNEFFSVSVLVGLLTGLVVGLLLVLVLQRMTHRRKRKYRRRTSGRDRLA